MLQVIEGSGAGERPARRHKAILQTVRRIERHMLDGNLGEGRLLARNLTPIERAFVTERLFRIGFGEDLVVRVLAR